MANRDIARLLSEAADEVEIGIAPYDAVLRGGRRRKARRWAVATATALVLVGSAGSLAVAGLPSGDGADRGPAVATQPTQAMPPGLLKPWSTVLAVGTEKGRKWTVTVDVWAPPRDKAQAQAQWKAMAESWMTPTGISRASELVGKSTYVVQQSIGAETREALENTVLATETLSGTDVQAGAFPLEPGSGGPQRMVIGQVAKTAQEVTCTWRDGTTTVVPRLAEGEFAALNDAPVIRPAQGSPVNWFVCLAPEGRTYKSVEVTK
ncbi:hypothetical protein [Streptomyces sp. UG1]|uniref:hypothetical protein n=1 Tax=Streptomyces sp. UG1 TaxID=3417652 RepID=UPI003CE6E322